MAGTYHVRSISLRSRSHPITLRIEDELNRHKKGEASPLSKSEKIFACLLGLEDLYECMDDLLNMSSTKQVLYQHQHEKCIDEFLDGSVRLLDICGIARDNMFQIKEHVHALQSALRRRKEDSSIENNILNYTRLRKEMKKQGKKLITELKKMGNKISPLLVQDHHLAAVIRVLREVNVISTSIFQSFFSFLSAPISSKPTRCSLVSNLMHKGLKSYEEKQENVNELESVDAALCRHTSDVEKMQIAHKRLVTLDSSIEGLENHLECVFRRLIKARTSLLNIISQ